MASNSHLPFFSYAFASLLFISTLLSLSHASIEQPSSVKCPIPASLEPNSNISLEPLPWILDSETLVASTEQQSSIKPPIPASHEPDPDRSSATPSLHSDILPVSEPLPYVSGSETLAASIEQPSSIKPPISASHESDPDRSSTTPSLHSDILPVSELLPYVSDSETLGASIEQQSSIKPPSPASRKPDPDRSSATPSLHSDILPNSRKLKV
nr:hypothetical protein CFP56_03552 [Quercus suber]